MSARVAACTEEIAHNKIKTGGSNMNMILLYFAIKYKGDWDKIYKALEVKEKVSLQEIRELEEKAKAEGWKWITIIDVDYPDQLKEAYKPPFVIWLKGNEKLLSSKFAGFIAQGADKETKSRIDKTVPAVLKTRKLITSDQMDNQAIVDKYGKGVLHIASNGVDKYKGKVDSKDLIISEIPLGLPTNKDRRRTANRTTAAFMTQLTLFKVDKDFNKNNLLTNVLNLGKEVNVFPGDASENDGNSILVQQGANLITSHKDIQE